MKSKPLIILCTLATALMVNSSCQRNSDEVWEDTKTAGRYVGRGLRAIGGKSGDSRQIPNREAFGIANNYRNDFIPLYDEEAERELAIGEREVIPQAANEPGDPAGPVPGIDAFSDPKNSTDLARVFRNIQFPYNSELIKGRENLEQIKTIANYMKSHPNTYIFVEGHCDERGPQAYNLALGVRRSNAVRKALVREGANLDNIFTISYGKERPIALGHDEESRAVNRRGQFKVYAR